MYNANRPAKADLPSTGQLLKSTGIAAVIASALLVTVVLPAYNAARTLASTLARLPAQSSGNGSTSY